MSLILSIIEFHTYLQIKKLNDDELVEEKKDNRNTRKNSEFTDGDLTRL